MYFCFEKILIIGVILTVLICCAIAASEPHEKKALKLKSGIDSILETNGTPLLQIGNFKGSNLSKKINNKRLSRRFVRAESSSKSEENVDDKDKEEKNDHGRQNGQSDLSDDADNSDSDSNRGLSTKGLVPEDFEPERNPSFHKKYSEESASE